MRLDVMSDMPWSGKSVVAVGFDGDSGSGMHPNHAVSDRPPSASLGPVAKPRFRIRHRAAGRDDISVPSETDTCI